MNRSETCIIILVNIKSNNSKGGGVQTFSKATVCLFYNLFFFYLHSPTVGSSKGPMVEKKGIKMFK